MTHSRRNYPGDALENEAAPLSVDEKVSHSQDGTWEGKCYQHSDFPAYLSPLALK